ncbi:hypothetical protein ACFLW4_02035 [Chloroflexota bacterium]
MEGEIMWTDEELQQVLQEVSDGLNKLSSSDKQLTEEEKRLRGRLLRRKGILNSIKEAKEKNHKSEELYQYSVYGLLVPWGERHPFLMYLVSVLLRIRWQSGVGPYAFGGLAERKKK